MRHNIFRSILQQLRGSLTIVSGHKSNEVYRIGDLIGNCKVLGVLGRGGFGLVYIVRNQATGEILALKTVRDELLADPLAREAFRKEALIWVNLGKHAYILSAHFVEEVSGRLFVHMDYVAPDGHGRVSLQDHLLYPRESIDTNDSFKWSIQFCCGMEYANSHGMRCHCDIKPNNIFIDREGDVKIVDFGLSRAIDSSSLSISSPVASCSEFGFSLCKVRVGDRKICGTPGYIAPEVFEGQEADVRSDIYSFGLVLWQMTTGSPTPPFNPPYHGIIERYMQDVYKLQVSERPRRVGSYSDSIIERCLEVEPQRRYANFAEIREELQKVPQTQTRKRVKALFEDKDTNADLINRGTSLRALGRYNEAISCYDEALKVNPRDEKIWINKGVLLSELGRYDEALECYEKALEINPQSGSAWIDKGATFRQLSRLNEAILCFDRAIEIEPQNPIFWFDRADILFQQGRYVEANACCDEALKLDDKLSDAWYNKAEALCGLERYDEAITCFNRTLDIDPRHAKAWCDMGSALSLLGRRKDAIACYDKALEIDALDVIALYSKGSTLNDLGRFEDGIAHYDRALEIDPRNETVLYLKANVLRELGRYDEAIPYLTKLEMLSRRLDRYP